jgi:hypothetical protein
VNQAVVFGLLGAGGLLLVSAVTGSSLADVVAGRAGPVSHTGASLSGGVAGVGAAVSNAVSSATGKVTGGLLAQAGAPYGWTGGELSDWMQVIQMESGGNPNAYNQSSGAALIGQFLPMNYGKYGPGSDPAAHPTVGQQVESMAQYIHDRYGTPSAALAHEHAYGWY